MYGVDLTVRLGDIDMPTIVLHGEKDTIWPFGSGTDLYQRNPHRRIDSRRRSWARPHYDQA